MGQTFDVSLATTLLDGMAAVSVVGVSHETRHALAAAFVFDGHAHRVKRTSQLDAHGHAFQYAQRVRFTRLVVFAVDVHRAVGQRRFFALRYHRIPYELLATRTNR